MSDVTSLLRRLQQDRDYLERFRADPVTALGEYDLEPAEVEAFARPGDSLRGAIEAAGIYFGGVAEPEPDEPEPEEPEEPDEPPEPDPEPPEPDPEPPEPDPEPPEPDPEPPEPDPEPPEPDPEPPEPGPEPPEPGPHPVPFPFDPNWPPAPPPPEPVLPTILPPPINDYKLTIKVWPLGTRIGEMTNEEVDIVVVRELVDTAKQAQGTERLQAVTRLMELM